MAETSNPGRVITIFRSRMKDLTPAEREEYNADAARLMKIVGAMPGFISFREYESGDGESVGITEWASLEALAAWRDDPEHRKAQQRGRDLFYAEYNISICSPIHSYSFKHKE